MACELLTKGRGLDCNRIAGGVKAVYFGVVDTFDTPINGTGIAQSAGEITDIEMGVAGAAGKLYRYMTHIYTKKCTTNSKIMYLNKHGL